MPCPHRASRSRGTSPGAPPSASRSSSRASFQKHTVTHTQQDCAFSSIPFCRPPFCAPSLHPPPSTCRSVSLLSLETTVMYYSQIWRATSLKTRRQQCPVRRLRRGASVACPASGASRRSVACGCLTPVSAWARKALNSAYLLYVPRKPVLARTLREGLKACSGA